MCLSSFKKNRGQWNLNKLENRQTVKLEATELVNGAKLIMDVDFIYVYKSKTLFWKSLVGLSPTSLNTRAATA